MNNIAEKLEKSWIILPLGFCIHLWNLGFCIHLSENLALHTPIEREIVHIMKIHSISNMCIGILLTTSCLKLGCASNTIHYHTFSIIRSSPADHPERSVWQIVEISHLASRREKNPRVLKSTTANFRRCKMMIRPSFLSFLQASQRQQQYHSSLPRY